MKRHQLLNFRSFFEHLQRYIHTLYTLAAPRIFLQRYGQKRQCLVILLLIGLNLVTSTAWARWVWVRGEHVGGTCRSARIKLEKSLTQHIVELTQVDLVYDGQALTCKSVSCARARLMTSGGVLALMGSSTCLSQGLQYTLKVIALNDQQKTLIYKKSIKLPQKHHATEAGYQLARRALKGPKLPKMKLDEAPHPAWGITLGMVRPNQGRYHGYGTSLSINTFRQVNDSSSLELRLGLNGSTTQSSEAELSSAGFDIGIKYTPLSTGLDLWLSVGITGIYRTWWVIEHKAEPIDLEERLWAHSRHQNEGQAFGIVPWIETGWIWSAGKLQPHLALRYVPLGLPNEHDWTEISLLFGLRWR